MKKAMHDTMKLTKVLEHKIIIRIMKENKGGGTF